MSYYYGNLKDDQIYASFEELLVSDHSQEDYEQVCTFSSTCNSYFGYIREYF